MTKLLGLIAATHTPCLADREINTMAVLPQAQLLAEQGVAGVFIAGTTGEGHSLTVAERCHLTEAWIDAGRQCQLKVIVHVGHNCLGDAQQLAQHAERCGAAAISALAPSYFRPPTPRDLAMFLASIAASAPRTPFYFYDIPSWTGVHFPASTVLTELGQRTETLAGVKYTNADLADVQRCLGLDHGRLDVLWGTDEALLAGWSFGCRGAVGSTYNFAARIYLRLIDAWNAGDVAAANAAQRETVKIVTTLAKYGYLAASKRVMGLLGVDCGSVRPPLADVAPEQLDKLRQELDAMNFFQLVSAQAKEHVSVNGQSLMV